MRHRLTVWNGCLVAMAMAIGVIGCRPTSTSYQVKWARPKADVASRQDQPNAEAKAAEVKPTAAEAPMPPKVGVDVDYADVQAEPPQSGWRNLLGLNQQKRVRIPRTDLPEDGEPAATDAVASEF